MRGAAERFFFDTIQIFGTSSTHAWGEIETSEFKRQSRAFAARLAREAIACRTLEVPGRNHFDVVLGLGDPASPLFALARVLFDADAGQQ